MSTLTAYGLLFFSTVFIARHLGPESFGKVSFAQILGIYLCILTDGMKLYGVREIARSRQLDVLPGIQKNFSDLSLMSLLLFLAAFGVLLLLPLDADYKILLVSTVGGSMVMASLYVDWIYQGHEEMSFVAIGNFLKYLVYVVLVISFISLDASIRWVGIATLVSSTLAALYLLFNLKKLHVRLSFTIGASRLLSGFDALKTQFILGMTSLRNQIFYAPVTFILGLQGSHVEAGLFNAAFKVSFFMGALGNVYMQAVFPRVCSYCSGDPEQLNDFVNRSTRLLTFVLMPIGFGGTLLSGQILEVIYGPAYREGAGTFQVLIWSILIMLMTYNFSAVLIGYNRQELFIKIMLAVSVFNVAADLLLIHYLKGSGAAWISLASEALVLFAVAAACRRLFNVKVKWNVFAPVAGSLLMYGMLWWLGIGSLLVSIFLGAAIYLLFMRCIAGVSFRELLRVEC